LLLQVISQSIPEIIEARPAWELMENYTFVADSWPGWAIEDAIKESLESLPQDGKAWALLEGGGWQWMAATSPLEFDTKLFGRQMARVWPIVHRETWPEADALAQGKLFLAEVNEAELKAGTQCLVARTPGRDFLAAQVLEALGFQLMDISVEWMTPLDKLPKRGHLPGGMSIRTWRPGDEDVLASLTSKAMCDLDSYADRFAMDPRLRFNCGEMYRRWVANSLSGDQADQVLALTQDDEPAGLITLKAPQADGPGADCGWVVINAISPEHRGKGLYNELLLRGMEWLAKHGAEKARVRTKLSQQAVIRAWARLGGRQVFSDCTFHLWLDREAD
jgi:GNAT superfamily N-acetyltransferase